MPNPFQYGDVVTEDNFCNRSEEIQELQRCIKAGQNLLIYSERRMGKTSLIKNVLGDVRDEGASCAYVDLWPTDDRLTFARALGKAVARELKGPLEQSLATLKDWFQSFRVTSSVTQDGEISYSFDFQGDQDELPLEEIMSVPSKLAKKQEQDVVVVFDEIQEIASYDTNYVERKLRSVIQHHDDVCYIFSGSRRHIVREMFMDRDSPFYQSAKTYPLEPISADDWIPFIQERFNRGDRSIDEAMVHSICEVTEGHPRYTQHLCEAIWNETEPGQSIDQKVIESAKSRAIGEESYAYSVIMENLSNNQKRVLTGLALEGPSASPYSKGFINEYRLSGHSTVQQAIETLKNHDLIDKNEQGFFLLDRFLKLWLIEEYTDS